MARLTLSFVTGPNERVSPLVEGAVQPEGVELIPTLSDLTKEKARIEDLFAPSTLDL